VNLDLITKVLKLRQAALRVTAGKLTRGLDATRNSDRLYDMMGYHGTHTGRPIGRGMQLLNLPKGVPLPKDWLPTSLADVDAILAWSTAKRREKDPKAPEVTADDVLSSLIRPTLYAENLCKADYNAIEARGVAWMAGEEILLDLFRKGGDPYLDIAGVLGTTRPIGKIIILGCGYGMSDRKFEAYAKQNNIDLEKVGLQPKQVIAAYRGRYKKIVSLWRQAGFAIKRAVKYQKETEVGHCLVSHDGKTLHVRLPSGRVLNYRNARMEMRMPGYPTDAPIETVVYTAPTRRTVEDPALWGSKAIENWCQAICRDLCYASLTRCEAEGLHPVLHAYDEIVTEDPPERLVDLVRIMETVPEWASGFPIKAEGANQARYTK
jgi:DNA polymerase